MSVVECADESVAGPVGEFGKGETLKHMVEEYQDGSHTTESVEQLVVGLGVGKAGRGRGHDGGG